MDDAMPAQKVRGALPDPVAPSGVDRRLHDSRMVGEPQVVVAAERKVLPPADDDARPLRPLADEAAAQEAAAPDFCELVGEALKDQGRNMRRKATRLMLAI